MVVDVLLWLPPFNFSLKKFFLPTYKELFQSVSFLWLKNTQALMLHSLRMIFIYYLYIFILFGLVQISRMPSLLIIFGFMVYFSGWGGWHLLFLFSMVGRLHCIFKAVCKNYITTTVKSTQKWSGTILIIDQLF